MFEDEFPIRLAALRTQKGVSARDMSLSIGQNAGYINNIETGKALPSMSSFFYICDYLEISPYDFFDTKAKYPGKIKEITDNLIKLNDKQLSYISELIKDLTDNK